MKLSSILASLAIGRGARMADRRATSSESAVPPTLNSLARDLQRVESVREIKDLTRTFAQLAQIGRWADMSALFSESGTLRWDGTETSIANGPAAIKSWLQTDAGKMDGVQPGSLDLLIAETPVITLSVDGLTAKGRFNGMRFMGDGQGSTRLQGGVFVNDYVLSDGSWKISYLHYYGLFAGPYSTGWRTINNSVGIAPYHFTAWDTRPVPLPAGEAPSSTKTAEELAFRLARLTDEDEVRNLQNAYGYYVDRRMWTDVVDLFAPSPSVRIGNTTYNGTEGVRRAMERMGPEGLTQGILNDRPLYDTIVDINPSGQEATTRGIEFGMLGDADKKAASWEFSTFHNSFVKDKGLWKIQSLDISPFMIADYYKGWGNGSTAPVSSRIPSFINVTARSMRFPGLRVAQSNLTELQRQLNRSLGYDSVDNLNGAYGFYADDQRCDPGYSTLHAKYGNKLSPFTGWYYGTERIAKSCYATYGNTTTQQENPLRTSISFHWRPQPVVHVSHDGRSASSRTRLFQPTCSNNSSGTMNGAIYHDQMVLDPEDGGKWKLWSITIDEHYFTSNSWVGGWSGVSLPKNDSSSSNSSRTSPPPGSLASKFPPDVTVAEVGERESTFRAGSGRYIGWPEIQRMWFAYKNPVSGRTPEFYWPGCVPCHYRPDWALTAHGYEEPAAEPVLVSDL